MPAAGASLMAWAVANIFTTLWIEPRLWVAPAIAAAVILIGSRHARWREWLRTIGFGFVIGAAAAIGIFFAGYSFQNHQVLEITPDQNGTVTLNWRGAAVSGMLCHIWPDSEVLGKTPGKELRRWISCEVNGRFSVCREGAVSSAAMCKTRSVLLFGRQVERYEAVTRADLRVGLVHPTVPPPVETRPRRKNETVVLVLPEIDELGLNDAWRSWGKAVGARLIISRGVGQDIRAAWPDIMLSLEQS